MKESNIWNQNKYSKHADFVSNLALPLIDLLNPKANEHILDLGCGDGTLALEIKKKTNNVIGVDLSANMVQKAKDNGIQAYIASATNLNFENQFDAVFSNAVLHWLKEPNLALDQVYKVLKQKSRFIAEFGAYGNIQRLVKAIDEVFSKNKDFGTFINPWYFPTQTEYIQLLEEHSFYVQSIETIVRPTPIDDILNCLDIFANGIIDALNEQQKIDFKSQVKEILQDELYNKIDGWHIDYVRLRFKAIKV
jgi:trans-aconitate methyltransferase